MRLRAEKERPFRDGDPLIAREGQHQCIERGIHVRIMVLIDIELKAQPSIKQPGPKEDLKCPEFAFPQSSYLACL